MSTPHFNPIIFDLDGTLTDSKAGIVNGIQYALEKEGLPHFDEAQIVQYIGGPLREVICKHHGLDDDAATRLIDRFRDYYRRIGIYENRLFPGVKELLDSLHRRGIRLAVATAKPTDSAQLVLQMFRLADYFSVLSGSDVSVDRRTKTDILRHALDQLKIGPNDSAVMVGDRRYDIEAAHNCQITSIGLTHGYGSAEELEEAGATHVVQNFEELAVLLEA